MNKRISKYCIYEGEPNCIKLLCKGCLYYNKPIKKYICNKYKQCIDSKLCPHAKPHEIKSNPDPVHGFKGMCNKVECYMNEELNAKCKLFKQSTKR